MVTDRWRLPRASQRHNRKNKFVDFVGEYHISLLQVCLPRPTCSAAWKRRASPRKAEASSHRCPVTKRTLPRPSPQQPNSAPRLLQESGACPILIPRTDGTLSQLEAYLVGGVDGLLVMEGNDIGERYRPYGDGPSGLPEDLLSAVKCKYEGDVETDAVKDSIEMRLVRELVLRRNVPYLGLCRGSQLLNVAMGGTLYWDIAAETGSMVPHMDYDNYDGHRHDVVVRPDTPLAEWFAEQCTGPLAAEARLSVNSYHHQGVKALAPGLTPMCFSDDGMIEGFYDPRQFDPGAGAFRVGLQWHPERMLGDYPGCRRVYEAFVRAAAAHRRRAEAEEARFAQRAAEAAVRARMAEWQPAEHRGATLAGAGARHQRRLAHNRASLRTPGASKALRVEDARWAA